MENLKMHTPDPGEGDVFRIFVPLKAGKGEKDDKYMLSERQGRYWN